MSNKTITCPNCYYKKEVCSPDNCPYIIVRYNMYMSKKDDREKGIKEISWYDLWKDFDVDLVQLIKKHRLDTKFNYDANQLSERMIRAADENGDNNEHL